MKKKLFITVVTLFSLARGSAQLAMVANAAQNSTVNSTVIPEPSENPLIKKKELSGSIEMNYLEHYIWRGSAFGSNDVAQPELVLTHDNFSLALCANLNYAPKNLPKEYYTHNTSFDEQDVEIRYTNKWGKFDCEFKATAFFYFSQIDCPNSGELSSWTGYPIYKELSFFTENSIDVYNFRGAVYSNNGLYFEHLFKNNINIEWSAYAGFANKKFNAAYFESGSGGLNLIGSNLVVTKDIGNFFIKVTGELNRYTNNNIKTSTGLNGTDNIGFGAGINF